MLILVLKAKNNLQDFKYKFIFPANFINLCYPQSLVYCGLH